MRMSLHTSVKLENCDGEERRERRSLVVERDVKIWRGRERGERKERNHPTCINDTIPILPHEVSSILQISGEDGSE